jgi:hypothetical protein
MPDATEKETADGTTTDATEDKELAAIKAVLDALTPLKPDARSNVIDYVAHRGAWLLEQRYRRPQVAERPFNVPRRHKIEIPHLATARRHAVTL